MSGNLELLQVQNFAIYQAAVITNSLPTHDICYSHKHMFFAVSSKLLFQCLQGLFDIRLSCIPSTRIFTEQGLLISRPNSGCFSAIVRFDGDPDGIFIDAFRCYGAFWEDLLNARHRRVAFLCPPVSVATLYDGRMKNKRWNE